MLRWSWDAELQVYIIKSQFHIIEVTYIGLIVTSLRVQIDST